MSELNYEVERPRYKRLDKSMPAASGRRQRAEGCDELIRRMSLLVAADPPLAITSHAVGRELLESPSPMDDVPYKHREDALDAMLCAWTAAIWHRHGVERIQVLGENDAPDADGRIATIVAPARPEQRVKGRAMRAIVQRAPADRGELPEPLGPESAMNRTGPAADVVRRAIDQLRHIQVRPSDLMNLLDAQLELRDEISRLSRLQPEERRQQ